LRWSSVDLDAGRLAIVETRVVIDARPVTSKPKAGSARSIPLDPRLIAELRAHQIRQRRDEHWRAGEAWVGTGHLFVDELGRPYRPETVSRMFGRLAEAAGLRRIRLHDLRHTAATLMIANGTP